MTFAHKRVWPLGYVHCFVIGLRKTAEMGEVGVDMRRKPVLIYFVGLRRVARRVGQR